MEPPITLEPVPDVVVEVTTPTTRLNDLLDRVKEAFALGVRMVWVVSPRHRLVYLYDSFVTVRILAREGVLAVFAGLPGLRRILADVFTLPEWRESSPGGKRGTP
jgi:Uma2 family endonuclease